MRAYISIARIDFTLQDKILLEYTTLFFPDEYRKIDKTMLKYFQ